MLWQNTDPISIRSGDMEHQGLRLGGAETEADHRHQNIDSRENVSRPHWSLALPAQVEYCAVVRQTSGTVNLFSSY